MIARNYINLDDTPRFNLLCAAGYTYRHILLRGMMPALQRLDCLLQAHYQLEWMLQ